MGVLRFRDNFKRFPEYSDAIAALRPGSSFGITMNDYNSLYWQAESNTDMPPTEEEIKAIVESDNKEKKIIAAGTDPKDQKFTLLTANGKIMIFDAVKYHVPFGPCAPGVPLPLELPPPPLAPAGPGAPCTP